MIVVGMVTAVTVDMGLDFFGFNQDKILIGRVDGLVVFKNADITDIVMNGL